MRNFGKTNAVAIVSLFVLSCTIAFAQEKKADTQKNKEAEVFDVNNATLEQTQKWLKETLMKYGSFTIIYDSGNGNRRATTSRIENIKFKGCEMTYTRISKYDPLASTSINAGYVERGGLNKNENSTAFDSGNSLINTSRIVGKATVNLTNLDLDKIKTNDLAEVRSSTFFIPNKKNAGKVFWLQLFSREDLSEDSDTAEADLYGNDYFSTYNTSKASRRIFITDKQVANQVKDAIIHAAKLCQ